MFTSQIYSTTKPIVIQVLKNPPFFTFCELLKDFTYD